MSTHIKKQAKFLLAGLLLIIVGLYVSLPLRNSQTSVDTTAPLDKQNQQLNPIILDIPSLRLSLPVEESDIVGKEWNVSATGVSHLSSSSKLGKNGNVILYGHNKKNILGPIINRIKAGDMIVLYAKNGEKFTYIVSGTKVVRENDLGILEDTDEETLTLYTCTGFADLKRYVVVAKQR